MPKATTSQRDPATPRPKKEEKDASKTGIIWDQLHSDPILDVVIKSNDDIYFRSSSPFLARET